VLDSGATNHMAAGEKGLIVRTAGSRAEVTLANGEKVPLKGHGHVSMDVGKGKAKTRMVLGEAMLVPDLTSNLLSVRAVDRNRGAIVFVGNACYILSDGDAVHSSGVLDKASVVGKVNDLEQYVLKVTPVKASACAASTRVAREAELRHRRFKHLGLENLKRAATMVDGVVLRQRRCTLGCGRWCSEAGWSVVCRLCGVPLQRVSACGARVWVSSSDFPVLTAGRVNPDWVVSCIGGNYLHRRYLAARDRAN